MSELQLQRARSLWARLERGGESLRWRLNGWILRWSIARDIRSLRVQRGWSKRELSIRSGVSVMTIWRLESGLAGLYVHISTLQRLAKAFDVCLKVSFETWSDWCIRRAIEQGPFSTYVVTFDKDPGMQQRSRP